MKDLMYVLILCTLQNWMEGDEEYHKDLMVPVLLVYGLLDKFVNLDEEEWMEEVCTTE